MTRGRGNARTFTVLLTSPLASISPSFELHAALLSASTQSHSEGNNVQRDDMVKKLRLVCQVAGKIWPGQP